MYIKEEVKLKTCMCQTNKQKNQQTSKKELFSKFFFLSSPGKNFHGKIFYGIFMEKSGAVKCK